MAMTIDKNSDGGNCTVMVVLVPVLRAVMIGMVLEVVVVVLMAQ